MLKLTTIVPPAPALEALDAAKPDGLCKEIIARAAALGLVKGLHDPKAAALCELFDLLLPAAESPEKVVNAVVKRLVVLEAVAVPRGVSVPDALTDLASAVADVVQSKHLTVKQLPPPPAPAKAAAGGGLFDPDAPEGGGDVLAGVDLTGPEWSVLRQVLTRTFKAVKPEVWVTYRTLKDSGAPTAKAEAYTYVFGLLRQLIDKAAQEKGV